MRNRINSDTSPPSGLFGDTSTMSLQQHVRPREKLDRIVHKRGGRSHNLLGARMPEDFKSLRNCASPFYVVISPFIASFLCDGSQYDEGGFERDALVNELEILRMVADFIEKTPHQATRPSVSRIDTRSGSTEPTIYWPWRPRPAISASSSSSLPNLVDHSSNHRRIHRHKRGSYVCHLNPAVCACSIAKSTYHACSRKDP